MSNDYDPIYSYHWTSLDHASPTPAARCCKGIISHTKGLARRQQWACLEHLQPQQDLLRSLDTPCNHVIYERLHKINMISADKLIL